MATRVPDATRNAMCDAAVDLVDDGSEEDAGALRIYTGPQPASASDEASGTLLAEVELSQPAFGDASAGVATLLGVPISTTGLANGTAGWARIVNRDDATVMDLSVSATGGGGEVQLNTTTISSGVSVTLTGGTVTQPAG